MDSAQSQDYVPTAKFVSASEDEMKKMSSEAKKLRAGAIITLADSDVVKTIADIIIPNSHYVINSISAILHMLEEEEREIEDKLIIEKINRSLTIYALNDLGSEIKVIGNRVNRMMKDDLSIEDRKREVAPAFHSCQKILCNFDKPDHIFYMHPLVTTPCLIGFAYCYLSVITIGTSIDPSYIDDAVSEKEHLKKVLQTYKENTVKLRLDMIKLVKVIESSFDLTAVKDDIVESLKDIPDWDTIALPDFKCILDFDTVKEKLQQKKNEYSRVFDVVQDDFGYGSKKKYTWDRKAWDRQRNTNDNLPYSMVVKMVYEEFFDMVIDSI
ncbi:6596_t:CDS:1 [Ambispora gerdemannii]|uniref:6596_t:CDS:1 n=1 Tax=Ambispora gerdemannii TaxID=144530 RepID=A0A9N9D7H9_9GLOM|nr:6596_t:CDS:1 [Ambispora gerdemannii]